MSKFSDLPLSPEIKTQLESLGFIEPTPIQEKTIEPILAGKDVMGKAETGTGKTLAFSLPVVQKIDPSRVSVQAIVVTPTRELAYQVAETIIDVGGVRGIKVATIVGGTSQADQIIKLKTGCQVVVGTPGRMMDFIGQRHLKLGWVEIAILDEADRMLDMGFIDDITKILDATPPERQTLLFSATFPPALQKIAKKYMRDSITVETARGLSTVDHIDQKHVKICERDKKALLRRLIDVSGDDSTLVFLNTKREADQLGRDFWNRGYEVATLHGDFDQAVRNKVLEQFKNGEITTLIATDVAQRGLDIARIGKVINYNIPKNPEDYVHRIGRTGRAGRKGLVLSFVDEYDSQNFERIQKQTGWTIGELEAPPGLSGWDQAIRGRPGGGRSGRDGRKYGKKSFPGRSSERSRGSRKSRPRR